MNELDVPSLRCGRRALTRSTAAAMSVLSGFLGTRAGRGTVPLRAAGGIAPSRLPGGSSVPVTGKHAGRIRS